ncbi:MAG TPA: N-acetylglucosamine-6-phosphate deacetylase [Solirubrobacterales bacterium]
MAAALVGGELLGGDVEVVDGRVAAVGLGAPSGGAIVAPGFVDLQVNGYAGVDFSAPGEDGYAAAGAALLRAGVTAFQPTIVTADLDSMLNSLSQVPTVDPGPRLIGAHLEGPFLSAAWPGAHDRSALRPPDLAVLGALLAAGPVSQMTLAPELPGALELIEALRERGVTVSLGHSDADAEAAGLGFDRGAGAATHLFNAMRPIASRDPGIAFAALAREDVFITLIVDGHHLADDTVRVAWRAAGERLVLISDAVAAAAAPDGDYTLGGAVAIHSEGGVVRDGDGSLAGSTLSMPAAVRNLHALGVPLAAALEAATETPARMAGRADLGRIEPGARADLVVLDDRLEIERVLLGGEEVAAA